MLTLLDSLGPERVVLLAGPTASGKSALALEIAEAAARRGRNPVVVNADSMQVYAELRVLTARPSPRDESRAPHALYGHVAASARYSVAAWLRDFDAIYSRADGPDVLLIVVGGTGLYFKALTEGLAGTPEIPEAVRRKWLERLASEGPEALHRELASADPAAAASIRPADASRLARAMEVLDATGQPLRVWQRRAADPPLLAPGTTLRLVLEPDRDIVYRRIETRIDAMVGQGALDEVAALIACRLDPDLPAMKAIGVREFSGVLDGQLGLEEAVAAAKTQTRRYAKRQMTWFRNQMADWPRHA